MTFDKKSIAWHDCMQHSFEEAANGIENWEYAGYESEEERIMTFEAAKEVAKLIRKMAERRDKSFYKKQTNSPIFSPQKTDLTLTQVGLN